MINKDKDKDKNKKDVRKIGEFILKLAASHVKWIGNDSSTNYVKMFGLLLGRSKIPDFIKDALINSGVINPSKYQYYNDIKSIPITFTPPNGQKQTLTFEQFKNKYLKPLFPLTYKYQPDQRQGKPSRNEVEIMENSSRNAVITGIGNCEECTNMVQVVALELSKKVRKQFKLPRFNNYPVPHIERVNHIKRDHAFNILNRPPSSNLQRMRSWIKNGRPVFILDLWKNRKRVICVNDEFKKKSEKRSKIFIELRKDLKKGRKIFVSTRSQVGEGHSKRWLYGKKRYSDFFVNGRNRHSASRHKIIDHSVVSKVRPSHH